MERRTFMKTAGISAAGLGTTLALAGCMHDGDGEGNGGGDGDGENGGGNTTVEIESTNFEVVRRESGTQVSEAEIRKDREGDYYVVEIDGTIWGSDSCETARLANAEYDADADELVVDVETYTPESEQDSACAQAIQEIEYRAAVSFVGAFPQTVLVNHDGEQVAAMSSESEDAGASNY